jgi:hypothetical protein
MVWIGKTSLIKSLVQLKLKILDLFTPRSLLSYIFLYLVHLAITQVTTSIEGMAFCVHYLYSYEDNIVGIFTSRELAAAAIKAYVEQNPTSGDGGAWVRDEGSWHDGKWSEFEIRPAISAGDANYHVGNKPPSVPPMARGDTVYVLSLCEANLGIFSSTEDVQLFIKTKYPDAVEDWLAFPKTKAFVVDNPLIM